MKFDIFIKSLFMPVKTWHKLLLLNLSTYKISTIIVISIMITSLINTTFLYLYAFKNDIIYIIYLFMDDEMMDKLKIIFSIKDMPFEFNFYSLVFLKDFLINIIFIYSLAFFFKFMDKKYNFNYYLLSIFLIFVPILYASAFYYFPIVGLLAYLISTVWFLLLLDKLIKITEVKRWFLFYIFTALLLYLYFYYFQISVG